MKMKARSNQRKLSGFGTKLVLIVTFATLLGMSGLAAATHNPGHNPGPPSIPGDADVEVEWHEDGMGFNVTSSKDISNVIVELCPRGDERIAHKHEDRFEEEDIKEWTHRENETIVAIWVKSGNNHDPNDPKPPAPFDNPGAGEYFENTEADCETPPEPECHPTVTGTALEGPTNQLTWTELENATGYNVYRATSDGNFSVIASVDTNTTMYDDTNVTEGTTYSYQVTATFNGQETEPCETVMLTAIPVFESMLAVGAASVLGLGAYAVTRRS